MNQPKKAGRKFLGHVQYKRNIHPNLVKHMDDYLKELKQKQYGK